MMKEISTNIWKSGKILMIFSVRTMESTSNAMLYFLFFYCFLLENLNVLQLLARIQESYLSTIETDYARLLVSVRHWTDWQGVGLIPLLTTHKQITKIETRNTLMGGQTWYKTYAPSINWVLKVKVYRLRKNLAVWIQIKTENSLERPDSRFV